MYKTNYRIFSDYYEENSSKDKKSVFLNALSELSGDFRIISGFSCRIQCFKALRMLVDENEDLTFIAYTDKVMRNFTKEGELLFPVNIFFRGDTDLIIKVFNKNGFLVLWSGEEEDAMLIGTERNLREIQENNINYDISEVHYDLW
ncbi:DUF2913 family protein [Clostridium sp.]|uniref:DUF2913 family protein n=1 Tax=Clostridium sp. TaxID=1506 RepID=UPI001B4BCB4A|nr:DUF2913 family protein [Clostridium sp.]MBP3917421.1 DUF2913 family protein [Clostridium sp.]